MGRTVLVTGVSRQLGGAFARALAADPSVDQVIGVDVVPPPHDLGGASFVRADIRSPVISRVVGDADTVVHMGVIATPLEAGGRASMKEINVIGTMQLLAACQKSPSVERLIVKSTSSVYGAGPRDPAMFVEGNEPAHPPRSGWAKDSAEVEGYVRGFSRRRPDVSVTTLRFANAIGPRVTTNMTAYLSMPVVPTVMGFDPRLQFIHEDDLLDVMRAATVGDQPGLFNVAGRGVILLSQALRRLGRPSVGIPAAALPVAGRLIPGSSGVDFSADQVAFLTYGRGIDTSRFEAWGLPIRSTEDAFAEFRDRSTAEVIPLRQAAS